MAHPRKKRRTQAPGVTPNARGAGVTKTNSADRTPKSMCVRMGASDVGSSVTQLVKDVRNVMEPHTASRLKERRSNKLRDYTTMAGPLGVTHFLLFYRAEKSGNVNLKMAVTPRGPTLSFHVEKYSLCRDVIKSVKRPKTGSGGMDHLTPPLLVMNNFNTQQPSIPTSKATPQPQQIPRHLETLTTSVFQSLFPPISPQRTPLASIRRILLVDRSTSPSSDSGAYILNIRHYAITSTVVTSISRGLKRLQTAAKSAPKQPKRTSAEHGMDKKDRRAALPNLSRLGDVADYLLEPGYVSASESELDMTDAEVEVAESATRRVLSRKELERQRAAARSQAADGPEDEQEDDDQPRHRPTRSRTQRRAIRLTELGPRMRLRLYKVEEGLCSGKTMWHEAVVKSAEEERELDEVWGKRRREREERRQIQRENIERKRQEKAAQKGQQANAEKEDDDDEEEDDEVPEDLEAWSDMDEFDEEMEIDGQQDDEDIGDV